MIVPLLDSSRHVHLAVRAGAPVCAIVGPPSDLPIDNRTLSADRLLDVGGVGVSEAERLARSHIRRELVSTRAVHPDHLQCVSSALPSNKARTPRKPIHLRTLASVP